MKVYLTIDDLRPIYTSLQEGDVLVNIHPAQLDWVNEVWKDFDDMQRYLRGLYEEGSDVDA